MSMPTVEHLSMTADIGQQFLIPDIAEYARVKIIRRNGSENAVYLFYTFITQPVFHHFFSIIMSEDVSRPVVSPR